MIFRFFLAAAIALAATSCSNLDHGKSPRPAAKASAKKSNSHADFDLFLTKLRKAVNAHDVDALASMMTANFGYRLDPPGEGEGVFQYWDEQGIWPDLQHVVREKFAPNGQYMVAPVQFASGEIYHGYRAGILNENGEWKFAYFVTD